MKMKTTFDSHLQNFIFSMLIMVGLFYPTGIAHELGHGLVCVTEGGEFLWDWVFLKLALLCNPFPEHKELSWAMGGIFGLIASLVPVLVFSFLRKHRVILNGFLGCAFMQLGYSIFESQKNEQYRVNDLEVILPIALMGTLAVIFFTLYIEKLSKYSIRRNPENS